jgi:hypothetical protein
MNRSGPSGKRQPPDGGWWSPAARRLHLTLAIALPGCLAAGWFELTRALGGREIAWVYAGEWPLYGVLGTYLWWRLLHQREVDTPKPESAVPPGPAGARDQPAIRQRAAAVDQPAIATDPELAAWQSYLDRLHELDPPGGPPAKRKGAGVGSISAAGEHRPRRRGRADSGS